MCHLFDHSEWREHGPTLRQNLSTGSRPTEARVKSACLPPRHDGQLIFDNYYTTELSCYHVQNLYYRTFACDFEDDIAPDPQNIPKRDIFE